jgi:hypothetical protein
MAKRNAYGVYLISKSMEQGATFRATVPKYPAKDPNYRILAHQRSRFTHYYFYIREEVLGPMVMRVASFFPFQTSYYLIGALGVADFPGEDVVVVLRGPWAPLVCPANRRASRAPPDPWRGSDRPAPAAPRVRPRRDRPRPRRYSDPRPRRRRLPALKQHFVASQDLFHVVYQ